MTQKDAIEIVKILKETYPDATCSLDFNTPFEMVVAVTLSAQCTDERVNKVNFSNAFYRKDIGKKALDVLEDK